MYRKLTMNYKLVALILIATMGCKTNKMTSTKDEWSILRSKFEVGYKKLNLQPLENSYIHNLKSIKSKEAILIQEHFFLGINSDLNKINAAKIPLNQKVDFNIIRYETQLNLERISLEKKWVELPTDSISAKGLSSVKNGREWYAYFLKKWVDIEAKPEKIYNFGLREIERVKTKIKSVQLKSGMDSLTFDKYIKSPIFNYNDVSDVQKAFETKKQTLTKKLAVQFSYIEQIPDVKIVKGTNKAFAKVPAYYFDTDSTFYYNFFDSTFNKRQISWLYVHEAMPGHHYQMMLDKILPRTSIQKMFEYYGYIEGYAAYIEEIGYEIGAYQDMYDELGKWEWDIVRSVRVPMDVGLNYYGWSDEKALNFWKQHIKGKDDIGLREISRMKNWPAQIVTYKYGADRILQLKKKFELRNSDLKVFHQKILERGSLPFSILEKLF